MKLLEFLSEFRMIRDERNILIPIDKIRELQEYIVFYNEETNEYGIKATLVEGHLEIDIGALLDNRKENSNKR